MTQRMLFMGACEYGRAASILARFAFVPMVPFAQLVCQSFELGFKAYLVFRGVSESELRTIGHNLEGAWNACRDAGLEIALPQSWLQLFSSQYAHPFTYRYWREGLGWSMPGDQKMVIEALFNALIQISGAIGDEDRVQLAAMMQTPDMPYSP